MLTGKPRLSCDCFGIGSVNRTRFNHASVAKFVGAVPAAWSSLQSFDAPWMNGCFPVHSLKRGETYRVMARVIYAVIVCAPLMLSSQSPVRVFGFLILISVLVGFSFASYAFTSIWCFLAAGLSVYMIVVLRSLTQKTIRARNS